MAYLDRPTAALYDTIDALIVTLHERNLLTTDDTVLLLSTLAPGIQPEAHWPADGSGDEFDGGYDPTASS